MNWFLFIFVFNTYRDEIDIGQITVEEEVYDTVIDGHGDDESHDGIQDEGVVNSWSFEMSVEDVIKAEKCIVFT